MGKIGPDRSVPFTFASTPAYTLAERRVWAAEHLSSHHRPRRGAVVARQAHNLEVTGSNPVAATFEGPSPGSVKGLRVYLTGWGAGRIPALSCPAAPPRLRIGR